MIRITGLTPSALANVARKKRAEKSGDVDFAGFLGSAEEADAAATTEPLLATHGVNSLLGLQEVPDETHLNKRHVKQGQQALERLDELRNALLFGQISPQTITRLQAEWQAWQQQDVSADPRLAAIMDEIGLRLAVEQAKLEAALVRQAGNMQP